MRTTREVANLAIPHGPARGLKLSLMKIQAITCSETRLLFALQAAGIAKIVSTVMAYLLRNSVVGL
jgi:hypothetical protein